MKKALIILLTLCLVIQLAACTNTEKSGRLMIASGIIPVTSFITEVAGDLMDIVTLIPPGNSPANYQPSSGEMQALSDSVIYFTLQMPTEEANILPKVHDFNKNIEIVNLRNIVSETYPLRMIDDHGHDEEDSPDELSVDPHLWLSPKRSILMVRVIADALSEIDPVNKDTYEANASAYISEIESLDSEIKIRLGTFPNKAFMIYHGSYGYFAEDYGFEMISIEAAGKQATAAEIQEVIEHANEEGIKVIFYQDEFDDSQAQTIADEIGGSVQKASPLSADYLTSMREFVYALEHQGD